MLNTTTMELQGDLEIVIRRSFNAPARIVFEAYTRADLVAKWFAPRALGVEMVSTEADVRSGGRYRYVIKPKGQEPVGFSGDYNEVTPAERLVYTQVFEPMAELGKAVITATFTEANGKTHVHFSEVYPSADVRDGVIASGMETGMRNVMDQLEELAISLASA